MNQQFSPQQQAQIGQLTAMGFPADASIEALFRTRGDVEQARQLLSAMYSTGTLNNFMFASPGNGGAAGGNNSQFGLQQARGHYQSGAAVVEAAYGDLSLTDRTETDYAPIPPSQVPRQPLPYVGLPPERPPGADRPLPTPVAGAPSPFRRATITRGGGAGSPVAPGSPVPTAAPAAAAAAKPNLCELCNQAPPIAKIQLPNDARDRWLCQSCVLRSVSGAAAASQPPAGDGYQAVPVEALRHPPPGAVAVSLPGIPPKQPSPGLPPPPAALPPPLQLQQTVAAGRGSPLRQSTETSPPPNVAMQQRALSARTDGPRPSSPNRATVVLRGGSVDAMSSAASSFKSQSSMSSTSTGRSDDGVREHSLTQLEAEFDCFSANYVAEVLDECRGNVDIARQLLDAEREQQRSAGELHGNGLVVTYDPHANSDDEADTLPRRAAPSPAASSGPPAAAFSDGVEDLSPYTWYHGSLRASDCERALHGKPIGTFLVRNSSRTNHFVIVWNSLDKASAAPKVVHILVQPADGGGYIVDSGPGTLRRLADVIDHYSKHLRTAVVPQRELGHCDEALAAHRAKLRIALRAYTPRDPPSSTIAGGAGGGGGGAGGAPGNKFLPVFSGGEAAGGASRAGESCYYDGTVNLGMFNWFHGKLTVAEAEILLNGRPKGSFVVRLSTKSDKFVIVWMSDNSQLVHILVDTVEGDPQNRFKVDAKSGPELYRNLPAVIQRYSKKHLTNPVPCTNDLAVFDPGLRAHKIATKC